MKTTTTFAKILRAAADPKFRMLGAVSGTRTGKSYAMAQLAILKIMHTKNYTVTYIAPSIPHLRLGVWKDLQNIITGDNLESMFTLNLSTWTIKCNATNSVIQCTSFMDRGAEMAKGLASDWVVFEEIIESATYEIFQQLNSRCRDKILFNFNPSISRNNWVERYLFNQDNCYRLHLSIDDNEFLSEAQRTEIYKLAEQDPRYKAIYLDGDYYQMSDRQIITDYKVLPHAEFDALWETGTQYYAGLDFGYINSQNALVITTMIGGQILVRELMYKNHMLNKDIADAIMASEVMQKCPQFVAADSAEQKSIDEINKYAQGKIRLVGATKGAGSVLDGINTIKKYKLVVDGNSTNLVRDIESYEWKFDKGANELINQPDKAKWDAHCIDSLSYLCRTYYKIPSKSRTTIC